MRHPAPLRLLPIVVLVAALLAACSDGAVTPSPSGSSSGSVASGSVASGSPCPGGTGATDRACTPGLSSPTPRPSPTPVAYTVRAGDTLTSIARAFDTTARSIAYWNRVTYPTLDPDSTGYAPDRISIGWVLQVWRGRVVDEADPPPAPSPSPAPSLTIPPGPTPAPDATSVVVSYGPRGGNAVALTFDMGGRLDPALDIVDWLIANDVPATVFPTGTTASTTETGRAVMGRIGAHPELFSIGNHTWDHPDMTKLSAEQMTSELQSTEDAVQALTGRSTRPFYRPPYGSQDLASRRVAGGLGWSYTVLWDVDTIDWKPTSDGGPTADDIAAKVLSRVRGGSIVLMHLGGYETYAALPRIVAGLHSLGLVPVTLDRLLGT
jgi:peptidoglycan/xylan/chitin deacetylase (PgdA/CDA1 family)